MKNYACVLLCSSILFLFSCTSPESSSDNNGNKNDTLQSDSLAAVNRAVDAFAKSVLDCQDSISKYKIASINDTCLKYIYVIYGAKSLKKYDSLTVASCRIKLTDFKKLADSGYSLHYTLFIKDTVPITADLPEGAIIHTFEYNSIQQKITKAYLGQHSSYVDEKELKKLYYSSQANNESQKYFSTNAAKLNPDFVRLVLPNVNNGK